MKLLDLTAALDKKFQIPLNSEDLVEWAVTEKNKNYINTRFLEHQTALMVKTADEVNKVHSVVFLTDHVLEKICQEKWGLIFTHHHFNYFEDEKGFQPLTPESLDKLVACGHSIYVAHAPLDTHEKFGTSLALAEIHGITPESRFYDYFGEPSGLIGTIPETSFEEFIQRAKTALKRESLDLIKHREKVKKIAVIAGGGDLPDLLDQASQKGCDTLLTGTVVHRWAQENIQRWNREFHLLNQKLKLNLVGGTHYATEKPAMQKIRALFKEMGIPMIFHEDEVLLHQG